METIITYKNVFKRKWMTLNVIVVLLLFLWIPVSFDKLLNFAAFRNDILNQPFSNNLGYVLIYSLPLLELTTVVFLVTEKLRTFGLALSLFLLSAFTGYIGVALLGAWEELPCGCGSVINSMSWTQHFFFNLFFLTISGWGLYLWYKLRGNNAVSGATEGGSAKRRIKNII